MDAKDFPRFNASVQKGTTKKTSNKLLPKDHPFNLVPAGRYVDQTDDLHDNVISDLPILLKSIDEGVLGHPFYYPGVYLETLLRAGVSPNLYSNKQQMYAINWNEQLYVTF